MTAYLRMHQKQFLSFSDTLLQMWLSVLGKQNSANKILLILTAYLEKKKQSKPTGCLDISDLTQPKQK